MGPACALWVLLALLDALVGVGSQSTSQPTAVRMKQDFDANKVGGPGPGGRQGEAGSAGPAQPARTDGHGSQTPTPPAPARPRGDP